MPNKKINPVKMRKSACAVYFSEKAGGRRLTTKERKKKKFPLWTAGFCAVYLFCFSLLFIALHRAMSSAWGAQSRAAEISFLQLRIYLDSAFEDTKERAERVFSDGAFLSYLAKKENGDSFCRSVTPFLQEICGGPVSAGGCLINLTEQKAADLNGRLYYGTAGFSALAESLALPSGHLEETGAWQEGFFFSQEDELRFFYFSNLYQIADERYAAVIEFSMEEIQALCVQAFGREAAFCFYIPGQELSYRGPGAPLPEGWRELSETGSGGANGRLVAKHSILTGCTYLMYFSGNEMPSRLFWGCLLCFLFLTAALFFVLIRAGSRASGQSAVPQAQPAALPPPPLPSPAKEELFHTKLWYLKKIITGEILYPDGKQYEKYGLSFSQAALFLLDAKRDVRTDEETFSEGLTDLTQVCFAPGETYLFRMQGKYAGIVLLQLPQENAEQWFAEKARQLSARIGEVCRLYLSAIHGRFVELLDAYRECLYTEEYCYLHSEEGAAMSYGQVCRQACSFLAVPRTSDIRERFLSCMVKGEFCAAKEEILSHLQALRSIWGLNNRTAKTAIYEIIDMFLHGISILDQAMVESLFDKREMITRTMAQDTFAGLQQQVETVMDTLILRCDTKSMAIQDKTDAIASYLQIHYKNPELSLELLAEQFSVSVQYLSHEFKNKTGAGLQDYLCRIRVEHAKSLLLRNPQLSVAQIGEAVGFHNSQTFIRSFKRMESVTPGQYRRCACAEKGSE